MTKQILVKCTSCNGSGKKIVVVPCTGGSTTEYVRCEKCGGSGKVLQEREVV